MMKLHLSKYKWHSDQNICVSGFVRIKDAYLKGEQLAEYFTSADEAEFEKKLCQANGQFAVIVKKNDEFWVATDRLRTVPLFYHSENDEVIIGDSAYAVADEMKESEIDEVAASAFLASGYTLNNLTLIKDLFQVEPGEMVVFKNCVNSRFYHDYSTGNVTEGSFDTFALELTEIITGLFRDHFSALKEKFIVIPLSGGYDSRLIATMCKRFHPDNVLCYTYGREDNAEVAPAREIARRLDLPWINIVYDKKLVDGIINDPVFQSYYPYASELNSMFFLEQYFSVKYIKEKKLVPENSIFMPGFSGDMIAGIHLLPAMKKQTKAGLIRDIISEHFNLKRLKQRDKKQIARAIELKVAYTDRYPWLIYENWDLKERQSKFIVNSSSVYNYFGFEFVLPFWDNCLVDFFNRLPFDFKLNKRLYDFTLIRYFFNDEALNLKKELNPTSVQTARQRVKKQIKKILPKSIVDLLIDHESPVLYDEVSKQLIIDSGEKNMITPPQSNNYNSYLTQWYLIKVRSLFLNKAPQNQDPGKQF